ncbi:hypothetical protein RJ640_023226 [Escallonia rubra]|uniref:Wall-associated receptor kinase galacturonan-binding domain-containing protein n=1 Tax=Escallonia rubra TaxID=112253 RepID=A0AA88R7P7_9ASTE|nr:hypothetical protein RJ640_023226 [Escallonia rubra]
MLRARRVVVVGLMALVCALLLGTPSAKRTGNLQQEYCSPSSCGTIGNITSPFWLRGDRGDHLRCAERHFELVCENNRTIMYLGAAKKYYVKHISYRSPIRIRVVDVGLDKDFCSILRVSSPNPYLARVAVVNHEYLRLSYLYAVVVGYVGDLSIIHDTCNVSLAYPYPYRGDVDSSNLSISSVHQELIRGFEILFLYDFDYDSDGLPFIVRVILFFIDLRNNHRDSAILLSAIVDHSSKIHFPSWIYDRIQQEGDMELGNVSEDVGKLARKMTLVALWCIQMKPVDRPSMSEVLDMREGEAGPLHIPPKPTFYPREVLELEDHGISSSSSYIGISITS